MKKCYCGQENDDSVTTCIQCGGSDFMGQWKQPDPVTRPVAPRKTVTTSKIDAEEFDRLTVYGRFQLRERDSSSASGYKTVATSLGGIKRGMLIIGRRQLVLKQRLTAAGGFLLGAACLLSVLLIAALPGSSPAIESIAGPAALVLLAATALAPLFCAWKTRRFSREFNLADITGGVLHGEELELHIGAGAATANPPPAPVAELVFQPNPAADLSALRDVLAESRVKITDAGQQELKEFGHRLTAATPKAWVTMTLIALNVAVFAALILGNGSVNPSTASLIRWGADFGPLTVNSGQWWRLLACCFLHASVLHLLFNMLALFQAGRLVERLFGNCFFLLIYLASGLTGGLASLAFNPNISSVGASGAIFGVYGALLGYLARERGHLPPRVVKPVSAGAVLFVVWNVFGSLMNLFNHYTAMIIDGHDHGPMIDMAAHGGGLLGGLIFGYLGARPLDLAPRRMARFNRSLALSIAILLAMAALFVPVLKSNALNPARMKLLAGMYYRGEGVQSDFNLAVRWFTEAAEQGDVDAEKALATSFLAGEGVPKNTVEGINWLTKIADQGADSGLDALEKAAAFAYLNGDGVPTNQVEAIKWLTRVADRGDVQARNLVNTIKETTGAGTAGPEPGDIWFVRSIDLDDREKGEAILEGLRNGLSLDDAAAKAGAKASPPFWCKPGKLQKPVEAALYHLNEDQCVLVKTQTGYCVICLFKKANGNQ